MSAYSKAVEADSPLRYWRLSKNSGSENKGGTALTLNGTASEASGPLSKGDEGATSFDGVNDYGQVALDLSAQSKITLEFWLKWDAYAEDDDLALEFTATANANNGFYIDPNASGAAGGKWQIKTRLGASNGVWRTNTRPSAGAWHHIVIVLRLKEAPIVYVDGAEVAVTQETSPSGQSGTFANSTLNLMCRNKEALFGAGDMAHLAIYSGVLSKARVEAHYAAQAEEEAGGTTYNDSGSGSLSLGGSGVESAAASDSGAGTAALSGSGTDSASAADTGAGSLGLAGSGVASGAYGDTGTGALGLVGTGTDAAVYGDAGGGALPLSGAGADEALYAGAGAGSLSLAGSGVDAATTDDAGAGLLGLSGGGVESASASDGGAGELLLIGTGDESWGAGNFYDDAGSGSLLLSGSGEGAAAAADSGNGALTLAGAGIEATIAADLGTGELLLDGTGLESWVGSGAQPGAATGGVRIVGRAGSGARGAGRASTGVRVLGKSTTSDRSTK